MYIIVGATHAFLHFLETRNKNLSRHYQMRLYTYMTPSHRTLFDEFLYPSLKTHFLCDPSNELTAREGEQITASGCFSDEGFNRTTIEKVRLWLRAAEENPHEPWIYCDPDICFYRPFARDLLRYARRFDLAGQSDKSQYFEICTGLFVAKSSRRLTEFLGAIEHLMSTSDIHNDQLAFIRISREFPDLSFGLLPRAYWSVHWSTRGNLWEPGMKLKVPLSIRAHHANYTLGVDGKMRLLQEVKDIVTLRRRAVRAFVPSPMRHLLPV